jgi:hypothetical protein
MRPGFQQGGPPHPMYMVMPPNPNQQNWYEDVPEPEPENIRGSNSNDGKE